LLEEDTSKTSLQAQDALPMVKNVLLAAWKETKINEAKENGVHETGGQPLPLTVPPQNGSIGTPTLNGVVAPREVVKAELPPPPSVGAVAASDAQPSALSGGSSPPRVKSEGPASEGLAPTGLAVEVVATAATAATALPSGAPPDVQANGGHNDSEATAGQGAPPVPVPPAPEPEDAQMTAAAGLGDAGATGAETKTTEPEPGIDSSAKRKKLSFSDYLKMKRQSKDAPSTEGEPPAKRAAPE
jgi:hypothetical protein